MGTDASGRDLFSRLLHAGRLTLPLAAVPAVAAVAAAVAVAALAGWQGPAWGDALAGATRTLGAFPPLALAMAVVIVVGRTPAALGAVMALWGLAECAERVAALFARARAWPFADAAVALGAPTGRVVERHLLPHLARPLAGEALGLIPGFLLLEATLGFFGFSLSPTVPTWGTLLWRGREALHRGDWWLLVFPVSFTLAAAWGCLQLAETLRAPQRPTFVRVVRATPGRDWAPAAAPLSAAEERAASSPLPGTGPARRWSRTVRGPRAPRDEALP
jgi:peptide/nickel transport system permease protein